MDDVFGDIQKAPLATASAVRRRISKKRPRPASYACDGLSSCSFAAAEPLLKKHAIDKVASETPSATIRPPPAVQARMEWRIADKSRRKELQLMRELRKVRDAPVDALFNVSIADAACVPAVRHFHIFVAVFLSSQTRDVVTALAMGRLKHKLKGGLTIETVLKCRQTTLANLMKPVAFHNTKAQNLKAIAAKLKAERFGQVPADADELCELPGIGPKMAHIIVSVLTGIPQGIGIDLHVHRISNKLGWVTSKEPEQTRVQLQHWLPYSEWSDINLVMVGLGQHMNSAKSLLLQRCLETSSPVDALGMLRKLDLYLDHRDKQTGQGVLHWAAAAGCEKSVRMLLKVVKLHADNQGQWPWDLSSSAISDIFEPARRKCNR